MSLLDNAVKHFSDNQTGELLTIEIDEWEGSIYFKPISAMNGLAYQKYFEAIQRSGFESLVDVLILRARTESGAKMFKPSDKKQLMSVVAPDVITKTVNAMSEMDNVEAEATKKS
jgi:hypothetical protein